VTRKITRGLNMILKGERETLVLGNLDAKRDWGHAKDFCIGMWKILQHSEPGDYVLSTNEFHSVREFVEIAFGVKGFEIEWRGTGINEEGYDKKTGRKLIEVSEKYFRPAEVEFLLGDSSKAREVLDWKPEYSFNDLVKEMVNCDCE
jgi:GDPmannose 4,6-dehydratase